MKYLLTLFKKKQRLKKTIKIILWSLLGAGAIIGGIYAYRNLRKNQDKNSELEKQSKDRINEINRKATAFMAEIDKSSAITQRELDAAQVKLDKALNSNNNAEALSALDSTIDSLRRSSKRTNKAVSNLTGKNYTNKPGTFYNQGITDHKALERQRVGEGRLPYDDYDAFHFTNINLV